MILSNSYAVVDLRAIVNNYRRICQKAGAPVMAIIKADAYGHGAVPVAKELDLVGDCPFFGVSSMSEAYELCRAGIKKPILILSPTEPEYDNFLLFYSIRTTICSYERAKKLSEEAVKFDRTIPCHIALDTGMSRIGFQVTEEAADEVARIAQLPCLKIEGLFSHFATADEEDLSGAQEQARKYETFLQMLHKRGVEIPIRHLDNSAGIMNFGCHYDMVRAGIILYGLYPSEQVDKNLLELTPAMGWFSRVSHVKHLPKGRRVSYGGTFEAQRDMVVATVPVGYADGYRRSLSGKFYMVIRGKKAPILGRVCMDQTVVDVTDIPGVQIGDEVELMGEHIPAEVIAEAAGSFNYEQVCDLGRRVSRVYVAKGRKAKLKDYLQGATYDASDIR